MQPKSNFTTNVMDTPEHTKKHRHVVSCDLVIDVELAGENQAGGFRLAVLRLNKIVLVLVLPVILLQETGRRRLLHSQDVE